MMTASKYCVAWTYTDGDTIVCRVLHSTKAEPCIEAARIINGNPFTSDVKVFETDSGKELGWSTEEIGRVLSPEAKTDLSREIPPARQTDSCSLCGHPISSHSKTRCFHRVPGLPPCGCQGHFQGAA